MVENSVRRGDYSDCRQNDLVRGSAVFYSVIGLFSGIISGMGIGGGAILIPALILLTQMNQQTAQGINLLYFLPTAVAALIIHWKNKAVEWKCAWIIGVSGVVGALLGSWIAVGLHSGLLRKMFGWFLLLTGIYEIYKGLRMKRGE